MSKRLADWMLRNKFVAAFLVFYGLVIFAVVTIKVFFDPPEIPNGTALAYGSFFAILGLSLTPWNDLVKYMRERAEKRKDER